MSHAAHGAHGDGGSHSKMIGITMAVIGVLIALCAALVGSARNEMTRSMIEQTQANAAATSASIKFRIVMISAEQLRGQPVSPANATVRERFVRLYSDYLQERKFGSDWANSYDPLIKAYFSATEGYEHAQLIAEVGIVLASLAVLMGSRIAWFISVGLAVVSIGQIGMTRVQTGRNAEPAEVRIEQAKHSYDALRKQHSGDNADENAIKAIDPDGAFLKAITAAQAKTKEAEPEKAK